jgi:hypothetical protein
MNGIVRTTPLPIHTLPERPVVQLAFARDQHDIDDILHAGKNAQHAATDAVAAGNVLDTIVLVPGYTLLLIALTLSIARACGPSGMTVFGVGLILTIALALADLTENYGLSTALSAVQHGQPMSAAARRVMVAASLTKWTLVALTASGLGGAAALHPRKWGRRFVSPVLLGLSVLMLAILTRHAVTLLPVLPPVAAHSGRSASITSTRDARAAGTSDASTAATTSTIAAAAIGMAPGMRTSSI